MWTKENIQSQKGKTILITGANSGIGYETALALYQAGAHVVLACRSTDKANATVKKLELEGGEGSLETGVLDLSSLAAVQDFADSFIAQHNTLDVLINNAGIMVPPASLTTDGFESQFGVNFIGHFALTAYLYPLLKNTVASKIVMLSSLVANNGVIDFDNFKLEKPYDDQREYAMSKLADLIFAVEMQRRVTAAGDDVLVTAAHPGGIYTDLSRNLSKAEFDDMIATYGEMMPTWQGALPTLFAATDATAVAGGYYGPDGGLRGYPAPAELVPAATDEVIAKKLWQSAEAFTGVKLL